jgi:hypothetical protein
MPIHIVTQAGTSTRNGDPPLDRHRSARGCTMNQNEGMVE